MSNYFGNANFTKPLVLVSSLPGDLRGYVRQTVDGRLVYVYMPVGLGSHLEHEPYIAEWEFERQPMRVIKSLRYCWKTGQMYWFILDSVTGRGSLSLTDGISNITHYTGQKVSYESVRGTHNDQWNGRIKVLVDHSYDMS
jgi:hypothetical protein